MQTATWWQRSRSTTQLLLSSRRPTTETRRPFPRATLRRLRPGSGRRATSLPVGFRSAGLERQAGLGRVAAVGRRRGECGSAGAAGPPGRGAGTRPSTPRAPAPGPTARPRTLLVSPGRGRSSPGPSPAAESPSPVPSPLWGLSTGLPSRVAPKGCFRGARCRR